MLPNAKGFRVGRARHNLGTKVTGTGKWQSAWSVGVLGIESQFDPLDLVAQLDGGTEFEVHALLDGRQGQQEESLAVNVLQKGEETFVIFCFFKCMPQFQKTVAQERASQ